ncbi:hypothetical protein C8N40_111143 [Pontibacter mucosus]|uniref:Uncharacterized protein n=1 Tax=Pontibacter mucosus TaxID=1649266 RepID=A0A2T5YD75_9BACT|nr:hypothetical protein [Pontibacter mucosus]PTX14478.1 hypothetical protein C8N40_111143 [Pontibacter mucosus]
MNNYSVTIERIAGNNPLTGEFVEAATEQLTVEASTKEEAAIYAPAFMKMKAQGQELKFYVDGELIEGNW